MELVHTLWLTTLLMQANEFVVGMTDDVWRQYKDDKEWMVASPEGYVKLAHVLAQDIKTVAQHAVSGSDTFSCVRSILVRLSLG